MVERKAGIVPVEFRMTDGWHLNECMQTSSFVIPADTVVVMCWALRKWSH